MVDASSCRSVITKMILAIVFTAVIALYQSSVLNPLKMEMVGQQVGRHLDDEISFNDYNEMLVTENDKIYSSRYIAPIVLEEYKLIFFDVPKVACSAWKLLFHRMVGEPIDEGYDWKDLYWPERNKLKNLKDYNLTYANQIMQDPTWTRAIFIRNPHERFLSAYMDKALKHNALYVREHCCEQNDYNCFSERHRSFGDFINLTQTCFDGHWMPYTRRIDEKFLPYMNFVGHHSHETLQQDAKALLERVGAWEEFGAKGWGTDGTSAFFDSHNVQGQHHSTGANEKFKEFYSNPEDFESISRYYEKDYNNPVLRLTLPELSLVDDSRKNRH